MSNTAEIINFSAAQERRSNRMENQKTGYIPLYRSILKQSWAKDVYLRTLWENLLLNAARKPYTANFKGHVWQLNAGQLVVTAADLGLQLCDRNGKPATRDQVERMLNVFVKEGMISIDGEKQKGRVVTIKNYHEYAQKMDNLPAHEAAHEAAHGEASNSAGSDGYAAHEAAHEAAQHEQEGINKNKNKEPSKPPKGGFEGSSLRDELIALLEGQFDFNKADTLHDAVESMIIESGFKCEREFRVADRGDGRYGRIDLMVSNGVGDVCGIEIDRINPRDKSAVKLKQLASGFILVRDGIISDRYELHGIPVVSAHPLSSSADGINRDNVIEGAKEALEYYNAMTGSKCRDYKPFMTLLTPTKSRDGYTVNDLKVVIKWVASTWARRNGTVAKPNNICRVARFDGYLSDALVWADGNTQNPSPCPHEQIIAIWNEKFPDKAIATQEWTRRRPAYSNLEAVWNGKTNRGSWREVGHIGTAFDLIRKSSLFASAETKPWLTLDWILNPKNWGQVYEQAINEHRARKGQS